MGCEIYNPSTYLGCAKDVVKSVAGDAFNSIAESFGHAADHAVNWLWGQMSAATAVHLGGPGFSREIAMTAAIAAVVALGLFVIQLIASVLRRDAGGLARAGKGLLVAFLGGAVAIAVVNVLLGATDELSAGVVRMATGTDLAGLGKLVLGASALTSAVSGPAALLLLSLGCIVATVVVYSALVIRKVLIVVTAVFAPVAFAGSLADITVSWTRRWIETTVALVVSKLILVLIFVTGYGILVEGVGQSGSGAGQKVTQVISGLIVLFLAGFSPWVALKLVHFTGGHAQQLRGLGAVSTAGLVATTRMAHKAAPYVARAAAPGAPAPKSSKGPDAGGPDDADAGTGAGSPSSPRAAPSEPEGPRSAEPTGNRGPASPAAADAGEPGGTGSEPPERSVGTQAPAEGASAEALPSASLLAPGGEA